MIIISFALLLLALSVPLILERVPANRWYGIRTPAAFRSSDNWYRINRTGGWCLATYAGVILLVWAWMQYSPVAEPVQGLVSFLCLIGVVPVLIAFFIFLEVRYSTTPQFKECRECGYNLTGNASGTCPECGERI